MRDLRRRRARRSCSPAVPTTRRPTASSPARRRRWRVPEGRRPTGSGWRAGCVARRNPLTARVIVEPLLGAALRPRPGARRRTTSAARAGCRRTRRCSTGWRRASCESGWDLKALQRQLVMSPTYRQSSIADAAARERDPANEWLARGPSLSAGGRADPRRARSPPAACSCATIGGPSVYPYQPPGLWEALATRNATTYAQGKGDDLHRRSLYTVWKRSSPPPSAISFDASERLLCIVKPAADEHAAAGAGAAQRPAVRRGGAGARRAHDPRRRRRRRAAGSRSASAPSPAASPPPRNAPRWSRCIATSWRASAGSAAPRRRCSRCGASRPAPGIDAAELAAATVVASTVMNLDEAVMRR